MTDYEPMADMVQGIDRLVDAQLYEAELSRRLEDIKKRADSVEIALEGRIDVENAYEIRDAVAQVLAGGSPARIEIDMSRVTFIDSVGVSALIAAFQLTAVQGVKLVVTRPSTFVRGQLRVNNLLALFGALAPGDAVRQDVAGIRRSEATSTESKLAK